MKSFLESFHGRAQFNPVYSTFYDNTALESKDAPFFMLHICMLLCRCPFCTLSVCAFLLAVILLMLDLLQFATLVFSLALLLLAVHIL